MSVIIPMRNEEAFIARCLDSVLANDYPADRFEVIVVDGGSTDESVRIVQSYMKRFPNIRLLSNPRRIAAAALNRGIKAARGDIIVRMDAHTIYANNYISTCVHLLETSGAQNVGGRQRSTGWNYLTRAIAVATTTFFGAGDAAYRYANEEKWVDTVYLGAWQRDTLIRLGGFDEEWVVNEDYELNYRLRRSGGRILLSPQIECWYYVRSSLRGLIRQYFRYGFWRAKTILRYPDSIRWRQLAAPFLVMALAASFAVLPYSPVVSLIIPAGYMVAVFVAALLASMHRGLAYFPALVFLYPSIHLSWGTGFWCGLAYWKLQSMVSRSSEPASRGVDRVSS